MNVPFVNYGQQYLDHEEEYDDAMKSCLKRGQLILRHELEEFEQNLAKFLGMKHVIGVADGTDAIFLALKCIQSRVPEQLSVTDYTFKATHEAIHHSGHTPVRYDINPKTRMPDYHVDIPVHIEGMVHHSTNALIEDACQALGAKGVGYSGIACYSFYPAKILGCPGDGGAIATNDDDVAEMARLYRHHWQTGVDEEYGYNSRLDNIYASYLNVKLKYLPEILKRREEIAMKYKELEGAVGLPYYQEGRVWQDYVITHPNAVELKAFLATQGIESLDPGRVSPHQAMNIKSDLPNTDELYRTMLRLPCNETVTDEQVEYVIEKVKYYVSTVS